MSETKTDVKVQEKVVEESAQQDQVIKKALWDLPGAPTSMEVEEWKMRHGEVYVSVLSDTEVYVWRPITRPEWVELRSYAADPKNAVTEFNFEEMTCDICMLWKSVATPWAEGKAGTPSTLQEQILSNSNFMSPSVASMLVAKL
jgi:hypothetical protein